MGGHSAVVAGGAAGMGGWGGGGEGRLGGEGLGGAAETKTVTETGEGGLSLTREVLHAHGLPTRFQRGIGREKEREKGGLGRGLKADLRS